MDFYQIELKRYNAKKLVSVLKSVKLESWFNTTAILAHLITFLIFFALNTAAQNLPPLGVEFTDITHAAGINFIHNSGAFGQKYLPENNGVRLRLYRLQHRRMAGHPPRQRKGLGRQSDPENDKRWHSTVITEDGTFTDVTEAVGLAVPTSTAWESLSPITTTTVIQISYISCLETDRLFQNRGDGTFVDITEAAGIHNPGFGTSCAWFDYNKDGYLDLYVANYVEWSRENDLFCTLDGTNKSYCTPESYQGQASKLFRNRGNGTFADVSRIARIEDKTSKSLGVCIFDHNADGLLDIFEANDTQPNKLYQNNGDGTFIETALEVGVSHDEKGVATGAMGVDADRLRSEAVRRASSSVTSLMRCSISITTMAASS